MIKLPLSMKLIIFFLALAIIIKPLAGVFALCALAAALQLWFFG